MRRKASSLTITSAADVPLLHSAVAHGSYPKLAKLHIHHAEPALCNVSSLLRQLPNLKQLRLDGRLKVADLPSSLTSLTLSGQAGSAVTGISKCLQLQQLTFQEAMLPGRFTSEQLWSALTPLTALTALEGTLKHPLHDWDPWDNPPWGRGYWGAIGSEAPSSLPVVHRLKRLGLKQLSRHMLNKQQVSGFMVAKGDISMLTKLESLCLDMTTGTPAQPIAKLPRTIQELHIPVPIRGTLALGDYSALKRLTLEVPFEEPDSFSLLDMSGVPSTLKELTIAVHKRSDQFEIQGMRAMPCLQKFTWWGFHWALLQVPLHGGPRGPPGVLTLMPTCAPSLREVDLYIASCGVLRRGASMQVAAMAERVLQYWESRPGVFRVSGIIDHGTTLEVKPARNV